MNRHLLTCLASPLFIFHVGGRFLTGIVFILTEVKAKREAIAENERISEAFTELDTNKDNVYVIMFSPSIAIPYRVKF